MIETKKFCDICGEEVSRFEFISDNSRPKKNRKHNQRNCNKSLKS